MSRAIEWLASGDLAAAILLWVGQAVLFGTILAGVTGLVVRVARRRIPPAVETGLWLIVLAKFLAPTGPDSPFSLASAIRWAGYASPPLSAAAPESAAMTFVLAPDEPGPGASAAVSTKPRRPWTTVLAAFYVSATAVFFGYRLLCYRTFRAACGTLPEADEGTRALVGRVCRRLSVRRAPAVLLSEDAPAPFIIGAIDPILVLSRRHLARPEELETVIVHEVAHLRRGDTFVRLLQWIAGTVLFFWPVVAWVNRRIDVARENACDQWALRRGKLSPGAYARCLLEAARPLPARPNACQPVCMAANPKTIERRIDMILESSGRSSRRPILGLLGGGLVCAWGAFVLCDAAAAEPQERSTPPQREVLEFEVQEGAVLELETGGQQAGAEGEFSFEPAPQADSAAAKKIQHYQQIYLTHLADHATADIDGNGKVDEREGDALLVALAMRSRAETLEQFPEADVNGDGELGVVEIIHWISGGHVSNAAEPEEPDPAKKAARHAHRLIVTQKLRLKAQQLLLSSPANDPTREVVACYAKMIEDVKLAAFLKKHPDADRNGDSALTTEERDLFMQQLHIAQLAKHRESLVRKRAALVEKGADTQLIEEIDGEIEKVDQTEILPGGIARRPRQP